MVCSGQAETLLNDHINSKNSETTKIKFVKRTEGLQNQNEINYIISQND